MNKKILVSVIVVICIIGVVSIFIIGPLSNDVDNNFNQKVTVRGIPFHIPEEYILSENSDDTSFSRYIYTKDSSTIGIVVYEKYFSEDYREITENKSVTIDTKIGGYYGYKFIDSGMATFCFEKNDKFVVVGVSHTNYEEQITNIIK